MANMREVFKQTQLILQNDTFSVTPETSLRKQTSGHISDKIKKDRAKNVLSV